MELIKGPTIGRGATATVHLAAAFSSGEKFAVKSTELSNSMLLQKEQNLLSQLSSPSLVKYRNCGVTNEGNQQMFNLCIEYVTGGTLSDEIRRKGGKLGEEMIKLYSKQILQGLEFLHSNGLAHCDIKSENILLDDSGVKIADLGCAKLIGGDSASGFSGTPAFMAPEVARGEDQGFAADIWAFGCTIIEMGTGNSPWPELNNPVSALYKIGFSGDGPEIPTWFSKKGQDFMEKCLKRDAKERWTAEELLKHPFLEETETDSREGEKFRTISPNSVLDPSFWNSIEALKIPKDVFFGDSVSNYSRNSPAERIKSLIGSSSPADWTWREDWISVRSNGNEENREIDDSDEKNVIVEYNSSIQDAFFLDFDEEDDGSSIFLENQFLEYSVENSIYFSCISDEIELNSPAFGADNENCWFIPITSFLLSPHYHVLLYNLPIQSSVQIVSHQVKLNKLLTFF